VAATFDKNHGAVIYINGQRSASLDTAGEMTIPRGQDLWLGKSHTKMSPWGTERSLSRKLSFTEMHWEGLIDEVKVYDQALSADDVNHAYNAVKPPVAQPLQWQRMPTGPQDINSFGCRYHRFHFHPAWDLNWQGPDKPGVLVSFDDPFRLTFWRGAAFSPLWFSENGIGMSHEFMERGGKGTAELMNDKIARYSSAQIFESTDARVVIYWRNAPARVDYALPYVRDDTGWGDWSEEYYTVYPDGVACRRVVMWTANQRVWYEWSQSLPILNPGQRPEDIFEDSRFVTLADMTGQTRTFTWPPVSVPPVRSMAGANIQVIHFKSTYKPFLIMTDDKPLRTPIIWLTPYRPRHDIKPGEEGPVPSAMAMPTISKYWWWNHWPVAQLPNDGRIVTAPDRVAHSWTSTQDAKPFETTEHSITQVQLNGMTDKPAGELVTLARSWLRPAELTLTSGEFSYEKYDELQRAYVLSNDADGSTVRFTLAASEQSPVLNPCFVIKNWGEHGAVLRVDDKPIARGKAFRYGLRDVSARFEMVQRHRRVRQQRIGVELPLPDDRAQGKDLIVYIQMQVTSPVRISLARQDLGGRK
jgi:hypothetical protein